MQFVDVPAVVVVAVSAVPLRVVCLELLDQIKIRLRRYVVMARIRKEKRKLRK